MNHRIKSQTTYKHKDSKGIAAQMEKLKCLPPLTVSSLTTGLRFSSQTKKETQFKKTDKAFFSVGKMDKANCSQKPKSSTANCWKTREPPLAVLSAHRTLSEELQGWEGVQRPIPHLRPIKVLIKTCLSLCETKQLLFHTHILLESIQLPSTTLFKMKRLCLLRTVWEDWLMLGRSVSTQNNPKYWKLQLGQILQATQI